MKTTALEAPRTKNEWSAPGLPGEALVLAGGSQVCRKPFSPRNLRNLDSPILLYLFMFFLCVAFFPPLPSHLSVLFKEG